MNRNQRRGKAPRRNDSPSRFHANTNKNKVVGDIENTFSPKPRREEKSVANRCCSVSPDQKDFGQSTGSGNPLLPVIIPPPTDQYQVLLTEQYGFDPIIPDTITQLKELKKVLCENTPKVENGSQYAHQNSASPPIYVETTDGSQWQNVNNIEDIDTIIVQDGKDSPIFCERLPRNIRISETPRVKVIAEKFSKYKRKNLELRRLDEKVVCVEYDIYEESPNGEVLTPVQRMRAFFSIKPVFDDNGGGKKEAGVIPSLPSNIKHKFDIVDEDLKKLTEKEIEIIDGKIDENKSYLEDLRRILKRKQVINARKNKTSLDLQSLYEMARKDRPPVDSDFSDANLLSKAELQEVKDLILQRCSSSVHGISRRRVKRKDKDSAIEVGMISESIAAELLREDAKLNVFQ